MAYNPREDDRVYLGTQMLDNIENGVIGTMEWLQNQAQDDPDRYTDDMLRLLGGGVKNIGWAISKIPFLDKIAQGEDWLAGKAREMSAELTPWLDPRFAGWGTRIGTGILADKGIGKGWKAIRGINQLDNLSPAVGAASKFSKLSPSSGDIKSIETALNPERLARIKGVKNQLSKNQAFELLDQIDDPPRYVPDADIRSPGEIVTSPRIHKDIIESQNIPTQVDMVTGEIRVVPGTKLGVIDEQVYNRILKRPLAPLGSEAANQQAILALYWKGIGMRRRMPYWSSTENTRRVYTNPPSPSGRVSQTTAKVEDLFRFSARSRDKRYGKLLSSEDFVEVMDEMFGDDLYGDMVYRFHEEQMTKLNKWIVNQPKDTWQRDHIWPVSQLGVGYRHYNNFIALLTADNLAKSNRKISETLAKELGIPKYKVETIQSTLKSGLNRIPPEEVARLILEDLDIIPVQNQIGPPRIATHKWAFELEAEAIIKELGEEVLPETTKAIQSNFGAEYLLDRLAGMSRKDLNKKYGVKRQLTTMQLDLAFDEIKSNPNVLQKLQKIRRGSTPGNIKYADYDNPSLRGLE